MLTVIPFLGILILAYTVVALGGPMMFGDQYASVLTPAELGPDGAVLTPPVILDFSMTKFLDSTVWEITWLPSTKEAEPWLLSVGDVFVAIGILFLALEIVRATRTDKFSLGNHGFSMLIFVVALMEFIILKNFATSTFFLLTGMAAVDVLVGMFVTIITARRDFGVAPGAFPAG
jgi:heme/copper-type cytochrome/quinol oxidase subunit 3